MPELPERKVKSAVRTVELLEYLASREERPARIREICAALDHLQADRGWDIPVHVDGASGGIGQVHRLIEHGRAPFKCRAGSRYLYVDEHGVVSWCSQTRGEFARPLAEYTWHDLREQFHTIKPCNTHCTVGCVHRVSTMDFWRRPQVAPAGQQSSVRAADSRALPAGLTPGIAVYLTFDLSDHALVAGRQYGFLLEFTGLASPEQVVDRQDLLLDRRPLLDRERRLLVVRVADDADDDPLEDRRGAVDDVEVTVGDRVVRARVDRDRHGSKRVMRAAP